jgi:L-phenylalanine/L-methionine N-acetyltransferase
MTKKITPSDFDFIYGLYMHPNINPFLLYEPMDKESFQPIFDNLLKEEILYIFQENGENIGMFKLIRLKHRSDHIAYLGSVGIHPNFAGKGFGKKMMQAIINLGQEIGLLRIELSVSTANLKAQQLYKSVGFEEEGILRKYTHLKSENRFLDEIMMSYLY